MISRTILISFALLAVNAVVACSSNSPSEPASTIGTTQAQTFGNGQANEPLGISTSIEGVNADRQFLRIDHYMVECEGFQVGHCLRTKTEDSDAWSVFFERIDGFDFQWGHEYELLVQVERADTILPDASALQYTLLEIISDTVTGSTEPFLYTSRNSRERIFEIETGLFSLLGGKEFTCTQENCDTIRSSQEQNHPVLLSFTHNTDPSKPLDLVAVLCSDALESFTASCL